MADVPQQLLSEAPTSPDELKAWHCKAIWRGHPCDHPYRDYTKEDLTKELLWTADDITTTEGPRDWRVGITCTRGHVTIYRDLPER